MGLGCIDLVSDLGKPINETGLAWDPFQAPHEKGSKRQQVFPATQLP
jgi:hypothetical protein